MKNCFWIGRCEYEQTTSYGTEAIKCMNTDCIMWKEEVESEKDGEQDE